MAIGARYCLMIEPSRDVNADLWLRMNVLRRDYFQGRIAELRDYRLEPVLALDGYPKEVFLKTCAVLSKRCPACVGASPQRARRPSRPAYWVA